jgi:hypothetical protein
MIRKMPAPDLVRVGNRVSEKIMRKRMESKPIPSDQMRI